MTAQAPKRGRGRPPKRQTDFDHAQFERDNPPTAPSQLGEPSGSIENVSDPERLDDHQLVVFSLRSILIDPTSSPASKASAARTLAEINGQLGKNAKPPAETGKPLSEMTRDELEAELLREA